MSRVQNQMGEAKAARRSVTIRALQCKGFCRAGMVESSKPSRRDKSAGPTGREPATHPSGFRSHPSALSSPSSVISSKAAQRPPSRDLGNSPATGIPPLRPVAPLRASGRNDRAANSQPLPPAFWKQMRAGVASLHGWTPLVRIPFVSGGAM